MRSDLSAPTRRIILLGASNLSRGLPSLLAVARRAWPEPLDVVAAAGRGRSYGLTTRLLGRELIGIVPSGLWSDWRRRPDLPTSALVTDIGNDIMYGVPVEQLLAWVEETLERLRDGGAETVITALPMERLRRLGPRLYGLMRTVLFPRNRATLSESLQRTTEVDKGVRRLAAAYGAKLVEPPATWYGIDPIHIRRAQWSSAWNSIVGAWRPPTAPPRIGVQPWTWLGTQLWPPAERHFFGVRRRRRQPCITFADGTRVSMY